MEPYALKAGEGWTYRYGIDMMVKLGELHPGRGAAFTEYTTRKGEEPPDHTHPTEDEIFYVLSSVAAFYRGGARHGKCSRNASYVRSSRRGGDELLRVLVR